MAIHFACPYCTQSISVADWLARETVECPHCKRPVTAPGTSTHKPPLPSQNMPPAQNPPPPLPRSIMTWEYKVHTYKQVSMGSIFKNQPISGIPADEIATALNQLGKDGWEAVGVFPIVMAGSTHTVGILLKRPCG